MDKLTLHELTSRLNEFSQNILKTPLDFIVHSDFLFGLSNKEFISAYAAYGDIMTVMYNDAAKYPSRYGYSLIKKTGEEKLYGDFLSKLTYMDKLIQIHHLLDNICDSSNLEDGNLLIDVPRLLEKNNVFPKVKKPDLLLSILMENGFVLDGYKTKLKSTKSIGLYHDKYDDLPTVIFSYHQSKYCKIAKEFDYAHMNYKLLTIDRDDNLPLMDFYVYSTLNNESQHFLEVFNEKMNESKYYYGSAPTSGLCWGRSQFSYSKSPEKKKGYVCRLYQKGEILIVRLYLKKVNAYSDYIEKAPSYIQHAFTNDFGRCNHCKKECSHRKVYAINGTSYEKCDGATFEFYSIDPAAIPHYMKLINLSKKS